LAYPAGLTGGARDGPAARAALGVVTGRRRFDGGLGGQCVEGGAGAEGASGQLGGGAAQGRTVQ
jgi:hypothetical protein